MKPYILDTRVAIALIPPTVLTKYSTIYARVVPNKQDNISVKKIYIIVTKLYVHPIDAKYMKPTNAVIIEFYNTIRIKNRRK